MQSVCSHLNTFGIVLGILIAVWISGLAIIALSGIVLSRKTLSTLYEKRSVPACDESIKNLRKIYKFVIESAAVYYYLSIPFPILITIAIGCFIIYVLAVLDLMEIYGLACVIVFVLIMISALIKSLMIKKGSLPLEFKLEKPQAPLLFKLIEEISKKIDVAPPDNVYLSPDASVSVLRLGSIWQNLTGKSKQCLIVGVSVLSNTPRDRFKAILAHELGHLYNKDIAGGSLALLVLQHIDAAIQIMRNDLSNNWYNPSWMFISLYRKIFFRISQGAARLQELMADDIAAKIYGPENYAKSLILLVKNQIEFEINSKIEMMNAINENREPNNIFQLSVPSKWPEDVKYSYGLIFMTIERFKNVATPNDLILYLFEDELKKTTQAYDSHPSIKERLFFLIDNKKISINQESGFKNNLVLDIDKFQSKMTILKFNQLLQQKEYLTHLEYEKRLRKR